jgi:hypothetical protein
MSRIATAVIAVLLGLPVPALAAGEDDERWIDQYMQRREATKPSPGGQRIGYGDLAAQIGRRVRIWQADGRVRRGVIEEVDGERVTLRVRLAGGSFSFSVDRPQVRSIELEPRT